MTVVKFWDFVCTFHFALVLLVCMRDGLAGVWAMLDTKHLLFFFSSADSFVVD